MSAFHMAFAEYEPDVDVEDARYGFCWNCDCNVRSVKADFGIGPYEYWGSKEVHHDWRDVCPTCEEEISDPEPEPDEPVCKVILGDEMYAPGIERVRLGVGR